MTFRAHPLARFYRVAAATILLGGCAAGGQAKPGPNKVVAFDCHPIDRQVAPAQTRDRPGAATAPPTLIVAYDAQGDAIALKFGTTSKHELTRLQGASAPLYTSSSYAWRTDGSDGYVTDIKQALVLRCSPTMIKETNVR